jgi:hypothetical protein
MLPVGPLEDDQPVVRVSTEPDVVILGSARDRCGHDEGAVPEVGDAEARVVAQLGLGLDLHAAHQISLRVDRQSHHLTRVRPGLLPPPGELDVALGVDRAVERAGSFFIAIGDVKGPAVRGDDRVLGVELDRGGVRTVLVRECSHQRDRPVEVLDDRGGDIEFVRLAVGRADRRAELTLARRVVEELVRHVNVVATDDLVAGDLELAVLVDEDVVPPGAGERVVRLGDDGLDLGLVDQADPQAGPQTGGAEAAGEHGAVAILGGDRDAAAAAVLILCRGRSAW